MLMTAVEENEVDIDVQVQWKMQSQTPQVLFYIKIILQDTTLKQMMGTKF